MTGVSFKTTRFSYCCISTRELVFFLQPLTSQKGRSDFCFFFFSLSLLLFWSDFQIFAWRGMIERWLGIHRGSKGHPTLPTGLFWQLHMLKAPSGVWSTRLSLTYNEVTHTSQICKTAVMSVWSTTVGTHSPALNTSKVSFWFRSSLHSANDFYQFGGIADLAMHSHKKVPGKKNYSNLHYGWHNTHVKRMTHKQSAQVSTSQLYCWWGPSSKGRLFLIPKVNNDFMFCKGSIISEFSVPCLGSIIPRDHWELSYGILPLIPKSSSVLNEDLMRDISSFLSSDVL